MSEEYTKLHTTATRFVESYRQAFSTKDASILSSMLTPDCTRTIIPSSFLTNLGRTNAPLSNADYEAAVNSEFGAFLSHQIETRRLAIDETQKSAFLLLQIQLVLEGNAGKFDLDFVFFLDMAETCDRIKAITQFFDTVGCMEARRCIQEVLAGQKPR